MQRSDFQYHLPGAQIARHPCSVRSASRLLCINPESDELRDGHFSDFPGKLEPGDLLVFNDTRVIPARLLGVKESGGKVEVLVERITSEHEVLAHVRASKSPRPGSRLLLDNAINAHVVERVDDLFRLAFTGEDTMLELLQKHGHVPLPPYLCRGDEPQDHERYQTIYAKNPGAVAAPTAGLHFDDAIMQQLQLRGIDMAFVTLHVGAGTFQPVRVEALENHVMHHEAYEIGTATCQKIAKTRHRGGRVVAVGTTVVRTLEAAMQGGGLPEPHQGETNLFITPGYEFRCVDALLTNFHLPESTLLMLVCAFAGHERMMRAYQHAIAKGYRFYSYGDAMFIESRHTS
ncbi:MAG: tRNA preQ1(34) S-adenosylmethionine ribosyltransferase-isomerase QueA [Gammaproteobacteria bacterium]|jgi:S-adenosylmethionine:tRNA ribosyltransferase-isomerase|nr:tRNA preQ1(34) S-adenosylmethionine ribosyltransferase-isomerase QueA [Gammaproteobacteria bacterium]